MDSIRFINVGYGNMIACNRIIAIVSPESAPIKRIVQEAKENGRIIDATCGRKTRAVIIMDSSHVVLSSIMPETIGGRLLTVKEMVKKNIVNETEESIYE